MYFIISFSSSLIHLILYQIMTTKEHKYPLLLYTAKHAYSLICRTTSVIFSLSMLNNQSYLIRKPHLYHISKMLSNSFSPSFPYFFELLFTICMNFVIVLFDNFYYFIILFTFVIIPLFISCRISVQYLKIHTIHDRSILILFTMNITNLFYVFI